MDQSTGTCSDVIDCACVIHGSGYSWEYVDKLYNMCRHTFNHNIRFHVYTESDRQVPSHMIKHELDHWGIEGPRKGWWYKLQLFNPAHHQGNLLYFDLDVVIVKEMEWIKQCDPNFLWAIRDFRYLQRPNKDLLNSSVMWWNVPAFADIWNNLQKENLQNLFNRWPGDQDYITHAIPLSRRRFFEDQKFESYRWQCLDGGYDFQKRSHRTPGTGTFIQSNTSVVVFHGKPKPHEINDKVIQNLWQ